MLAKENWLNSFSPNWEEVQLQTKDDKVNIYQIELQNPDRIFAMSQDFDLIQADKYADKSSMKLIILQDKKTLNFNAFFMEAIALDQKAIPNTLFYKNYSNFTGAINFYELNGNLANGWLYTNGKATSTTNKAEMIDLNFNHSSERTGGNGKLMLADAGSMNCGRILVPHIKKECVGSGQVTYTDYNYEGEMTCKYVVYYTSEINYCIIPPNNDIDDGGYGGGGGVTNSGNNVATNIDLSLFDRFSYPVLGKIVDGLYNKVKNDAKLMAAIKKFSKLSEQQILDNLKLGQGPKLVVRSAPNEAGEYDPVKNIIYISQHLVTAEKFSVTGYSTALEFYLSVSILHEFIHFGEHYTQNFLPHEGTFNDPGWQFENDMYGGRVWFNYATGVINYEKI